MQKSTTALTLLGGVILLATAPPLHGQIRHEFTELHMGMAVRIVLHADDDDGARDAARAAYARIAELEDRMSDYRPASEVRRLERRPAEWVSVSPELFAVLRAALHMAQASDGAFDPTLGPLSEVWREARRNGSLPSPAAIDSARARTGWQRIALDRERCAVRLDRPGMRIDLGGIAKGFILQEALSVLRSHGMPQALIEAGGDIVVGEAPPGRPGWAIEAPYADAHMAARASALSNAALATSGPTAQFVVIDGVRYSHVVDPRTGIGLTSDRVAMVIAPVGAIADALATALTVVGPDGEEPMLARFPGVVASVRPADALSDEAKDRRR